MPPRCWPKVCDEGVWAERCPIDDRGVDIVKRIIFPLSVEVEGVHLSGFYAVQSEMVTVWHTVMSRGVV